MNEEMILRVQPKFKIGDAVYVITDPDQRQMMVTGIVVRHSYMAYLVSYVDLEHEYEAFQLSANRRL